LRNEMCMTLGNCQKSREQCAAPRFQRPMQNRLLDDRPLSKKPGLKSIDCVRRRIALHKRPNRRSVRRPALFQRGTARTRGDAMF
jgi:hypothetical protein